MSYLLWERQRDCALGGIMLQPAGRGDVGLALLIQAPWCCLFCFFPWWPLLFCEEADFSLGVSGRVPWSVSVSVATSACVGCQHSPPAPRGGCSASSGNKGLWTLDLGLSNKGPIWQATKIPAQARTKAIFLFLFLLHEWFVEVRYSTFSCVIVAWSLVLSLSIRSGLRHCVFISIQYIRTFDHLYQEMMKWLTGGCIWHHKCSYYTS